MKTQPIKITALASFFWLFPLTIFAQETIELNYNTKNNSLNLDNLPKMVKYNKNYTLVLKRINSAHVAPFSEVSTSRFVSDIPDILRSLYIGIPDDAVGMNLPGALPQVRAMYTRATLYYRDLTDIQRISDDLYLQTRFNPNAAVAKTKKQELLQALGVRTIQEAYTKAILAQKYISSIQEVYTAQLATISSQGENTVNFLEEYATIKSYNDNIAAIDYAYLLNFIEESQTAVANLPVASFTAKGDVVDVALQVIDTYTNTKLVDETLSFGVYDNFSFDFSTGFFYNNLVEPEYYLSEDESEKGNLFIKEENKSNTDISIGALGHFTYKFLPEWRGGIAVGAAISPFDGKLRYLMGPTVIYGNQKQASFTFGLALSQIDQLSDAVIKDSAGYSLPAGVGAIPMVNKLKTGFFIGITYNLTNRKQS